VFINGRPSLTSRQDGNSTGTPRFSGAFFLLPVTQYSSAVQPLAFALLIVHAEVPVKTLNPFVPTVPLITLPNRSQRERFKTWFFAVLAAHVAVFLVLLLKDYRDELTVNARSLPEAVGSPTTETLGAPVATPMPETKSPPPNSLLAQTIPAPVAPPIPPTASTQPATAHSDPFYYVVKSGDTLSQLAKLYGTTVRAIKTVNNLGTERLAVGQKLKLPSALAATVLPTPVMTGSL
jgi:LysM repeat protein